MLGYFGLASAGWVYNHIETKNSIASASTLHPISPSVTVASSSTNAIYSNNGDMFTAWNSKQRDKDSFLISLFCNFIGSICLDFFFNPADVWMSPADLHQILYQNATMTTRIQHWHYVEGKSEIYVVPFCTRNYSDCVLGCEHSPKLRWTISQYCEHILYRHRRRARAAAALR